jgi:hypothetical protein
MRIRQGWRPAALGWAAVPALLLTLAGCAGRVWLDRASAAGITLHWYTREATVDIARGEALEHCRGYGKDAVLLDEFVDRDITTAHFACR